VRNRDVQDISKEVTTGVLGQKSFLPVSHPDYKYPTSPNPYWGKLQESSDLVYSDNKTEHNRGQWLSRFSSNALGQIPSPELHVEIGCNAGHVIVEWAAANPKGLYLGIDWKFKAIYRGAEKARKRHLENLLFLRAYAERLEFIFGPAEIDHLYLFFPDPWPKKAHWKHRFVTTERLKNLASLVKPGGTFEIKTDHPEYFEWMLEALSPCESLWETLSVSRNLHEGNPLAHQLTMPAVTLFERIFIKEGKPVHRILLKRRANS